MRYFFFRAPAGPTNGLDGSGDAPAAKTEPVTPKKVGILDKISNLSSQLA